VKLTIYKKTKEILQRKKKELESNL